jgi:hypothetical protein
LAKVINVTCTAATNQLSGDVVKIAIKARFGKNQEVKEVLASGEVKNIQNLLSKVAETKSATLTAKDGLARTLEASMVGYYFSVIIQKNGIIHALMKIALNE